MVPANPGPSAKWPVIDAAPQHLIVVVRLRIVLQHHERVVIQHDRPAIFQVNVKPWP